MKTLVQLSVVLAVVGFGIRAPQAHHSFAATFKSDETIAVEGVVTEFSFRNPHILVYLDVTDADGSVTNWMSEGAAANLMRRSGWDRDTLQPGDLIRVHGNSTHDGSPMVSIESIDVLENGAVARTLSRERRGARQRAAAAAVDMATLPLQLADGRPNLTGAWTQNFAARRGPPGSNDAPIPLTEAGEAAQAAYDPANDPQIFCDPPGLVRQAGMTPHPLRITQNDDHVVFEWEEYGGRRVVYFGDELAAPGPGTNLGDSIARYDGDALVVETVNLMGNPVNPSGYPLSDRTTTVERYTRADDPQYGPMIAIEMAVTDPEHLTDTWILRRSKVYAPGYEFIENDCRPPLRERG